LAIIDDMNRPMSETVTEDRRYFLGGLIASLVLHGFLGLVFLGEISGYVAEPVQEPIDVEIIIAEAPEPVEPVEEEPAPEEPAPEEPEPEEPEPEEPEPEEPEPEEPEPEEEETEEPTPEPEPAPDAESAPPVTVLEPVEEFGEEDSGPPASAEEPVEEPLEEVAEEDLSEPPESDVPEDVQETDALETAEAEETSEPAPEAEAEPEPETETDAEPSEDLETGIETADDVDPLAGPVSDTEIASLPTPEAKPSTETDAGTEAEVDVGEADEISTDDFGTVGPIVTAAAPAPKPVIRPEPSSPPASAPPAAGRSDLIPARQLFTRNPLEEQRSITALRGIPAGERLNRLCVSELRAQLTAVSAVPPELLPSFRGLSGNVLEPRNAAFRSLGRWFNVDFRCETDSGVTRVERFSFRIGTEVPPSEQLRRGLSQF